MERLLWTLYLRGWGRSLLERLSERIWWRTVLIHEAGHAVAWMARLGRAQPIKAQSHPDDKGALIKNASTTPPSTVDFKSHPFDSLIVLLAGNVAERLILQVDSTGFVRDAQLVQNLFFMTTDQGIHLQLDQEYDGEFPGTTACLTRHRRAVEAIGHAAFDAFDRLGVYRKRFEPVELLSASEVERLFREAAT